MDDLTNLDGGTVSSPQDWYARVLIWNHEWNKEGVPDTNNFKEHQEPRRETLKEWITCFFENRAEQISDQVMEASDNTSSGHQSS